MRFILGRKPLAVAFGESHAQKGTESIEPAVRRFTRDILPLFQGRASDLVVELLLPNAACGEEAKAAAKEQRVVTEQQAATNQDDYVGLATAARRLGIGAHALAPTCEDLSRIAKAGPDAVMESLSVVTRLAHERFTALLVANEKAGAPRMVLGYGGALHNDIAPRRGREEWSFGPALSTETKGRYAEVDLVVPEFIADTPAWRSLPWVPAFDPKVHAGSARLLEPSESSFVLVFAASAP